jgi:hypothetical protein
MNIIINIIIIIITQDIIVDYSLYFFLFNQMPENIMNRVKKNVLHERKVHII